jgi:hypothetical protein
MVNLAEVDWVKVGSLALNVLLAGYTIYKDRSAKRTKIHADAGVETCGSERRLYVRPRNDGPKLFHPNVALFVARTDGTPIWRRCRALASMMSRICPRADRAFSLSSIQTLRPICDSTR